jgi:hypothetical protein
VSPRLASERRDPARSHGQALSGQPGRLWSLAQNVIQVPSTYVRDQGPRTLATRKQDPPRRGLHSQRSKLGRCAIAPTGPRHVVLAAAPTQQELLHLVQSTLGSQVCTDPFAYRQSTVAQRFATPLHCRHSAAFNGLLLDWSWPATLWLNPPWHLLPQVLEKLRASRSKGILIYPYWPLQPWFQEVQRLSASHFRLPPPHLCVRSHHPGIVEPFVNREVQLRAVVFDCA